MATSLRRACWLVLLWGLLSADAGADPLIVALDSCVAVDADKIGERLIIEMVGRRSLGPVKVVATCRGGTIRLCVGEAERCRELPISSLPLSFRVQHLALVAAELLEDLADEIPAEAPPLLASTPALPPAPPGVKHRPAKTALSILGIASLQWFSAGAPMLYGGGLQLSADHSHKIGWSVDLLAHQGMARFDLGTISMVTASVGVGLHGHLELSRFVLRVGAGLRVGAVSLQGQAAEPWITWVAGLGKLSLGLRMSPHLLLEASGEGGYVVLPVVGRVDGQPAIQAGGIEVGAHLGVGIIF